MGNCFVGGPVKLWKRISADFPEYDLTPEQTRAHFADGGWDSVVGFQTRNVPHRAHESLLRLGLEFADGLFIQPLIGAKKKGDYTTSAILTGYRALISDFLPRERVLLGVLSTAMRYAGPGKRYSTPSSGATTGAPTSSSGVTMPVLATITACTKPTT